ncbi:MAG: TonB-dependent receptor [Gammaproteobacteria bacterium]|nr:TonB-dependent receptor [Gammaproteobacteria bacterium]
MTSTKAIPNSWLRAAGEYVRRAAEDSVIRSTGGRTAARFLLVRHLLVAVAIALGLGARAFAAATDTPKVFNIEQQTLATALGEFARQSDRQILFATDVVDAKRTSGIKGALEPEAALRLLLQGTDLTYRITAENTILVETPRPGNTANVPVPQGYLRVAQSSGIPDLASAQDEPGNPRQNNDTSREKAPPEQAANIQEVTVTGTRIKAPNLTSESPVTVVTDVEIKAQGATNIENVLNEIPQVHTAQSSSTANNSTGVANINLRGLGPTRTLVMIDGRRLGPGDPQGPQGAAADVNFIPTALITGVDVLTGGASAVYGSDAMAGVVNFRLLRNFEGVQVTQTFNDAQHTQGGPANSVLASANYPVKPAIPGNQFGGLVSDTTLILGTNVDDNKGNITMYASYRSTSAVLDGSRNFQACETGLNKAGTGLVCAGSSSGAYGNFITNSGKDLALNPNGTATFVPFTSALKYNTAPTNDLQRPDERKTLGAIGHVQLAPWLDVYAETMFMSDHTTAQVAPGGLLLGRGPTGFLQIPCNNQFLSAAQEPSICQDSTGKPLPVYQANGQPNVATILMPALRMANYPRADDLRHDDYRVVVGGRGAIDNNWSYDLSGTYWNSLLSEHYLNDISFAKVQNSLNGCTAPGNAGCVPLNIFQYGGVTPEAFNYITTPGEKSGSSIETTVDANISGDFGPYGGTSPWARNPVATSFGFTYRRDQLNFLPDSELQTNELIGQGAFYPPVRGGEIVKEEYFEIHIPVVENKAFMEAIDLDLAGRHSDYSIDNSSNGFSTNTFKIAADYAPSGDIRFRASYNRAARAPNLYELFLGQRLNNDAGYDDPCSGATPRASLAACARTGVTAAQYGNIPGCPSTNCDALTGGNLALRPEEADTYSYGFNFTPGFLPGFNLSVDYWAVRVNNYITNLSGQLIVNGCLLQGEDSLCSLFHRGPGIGNIFGTSGWVVESNQNIGFLRNRGIDVELNYRKNFDSLGTLVLRMSGTDLLEQTVSSPNTYDCAGLYGSTCSAGGDNGPNFRWRHTARLTWLTPWGPDLSVNWRYMSAVKLDTNSSQAALNNGSYDAYDAKIPAYNYLDLSTTWSFAKHYTVSAGVNNALDKDPPYLNHSVVYFVNGGGNGNTYGAYDTLGRIFFLSVSAKF